MYMSGYKNIYFSDNDPDNWSNVINTNFQTRSGAMCQGNYSTAGFREQTYSLLLLTLILSPNGPSNYHLYRIPKTTCCQQKPICGIFQTPSLPLNTIPTMQEMFMLPWEVLVMITKFTTVATGDRAGQISQAQQEPMDHYLTFRPTALH